jgi:hypothetical protein|tara:strand:- start:1262 stop:1384 length:123 start_codon:yes stop_codon:yes gene_type:complete
VVATFEQTSAGLRCDSPSQSATGMTDVAVSLNGAQFSAAL